MRRRLARTLHGLAEDIYEALEREGYWDEERPASREFLRRVRGSSRGSRRARVPLPKPKRKVSAYQREFGRQLKKLKKAHPRTPVTKLMKRAHAATKRARRGK
jgi:hypothetical protein